MDKRIPLNKLIFIFVCSFLFINTVSAAGSCYSCATGFKWITSSNPPKNCTTIVDTATTQSACIALNNSNNNANNSEEAENDCEEYISDDLVDLMQDAFDVIKFVDVVLVLGLTVVTFAKAVTAGGEELKKALNITIKRLIIGVAIFFIPNLIDLVLKDLLGLYGTCGIR